MTGLQSKTFFKQPDREEPHHLRLEDMTHAQDITRPSPDLIKAFEGIGSATCSSHLRALGIRNTFLRGLKCATPGKSVVGPALTLQFMPQREDVYQEGEYLNPEKQLHRHVMYHAQAGDIVVVDARGKMDAGIFGEMMMTYFAGRGGRGVVVDGCLRDWPNVRSIDLGCWIRGVTPNYHTQCDIFPYAVNIPIACGDCFVAPGDIIVADDDGAVVVPIFMAERLLEHATSHAEWEEFARLKLSEGGDLRRYYPLSDEALPEYEAWRRSQSS